MCTAVACMANRLPTSILVLYKHSYESRVQCICSPFCCLCLSLALLFAWIQDGRVRWWSLQQVCQSCKVGYKSSVINQPEKLCRLLTVNHSLFFGSPLTFSSVGPISFSMNTNLSSLNRRSYALTVWHACDSLFCFRRLRWLENQLL